MYRSQANEPARRGRPRRRPAALLALGWLCAVGLGGCSDEAAEWEERAGSLTLRASPLPPVAGEPLVLGLEARNVGPIRVFQGDTLIAAFANTAVDGTRSYTVTAQSDEAPRAVAVGFDFRTLTVAAEPFASPPPPEAAPAPSAP